MSDFEKLINASDLIEWIIETDPDWCVGSVRCIIDHIDKMPSAQPETHEERTETHACDCISRKAAIDIERNATVDTNPSHFEAHQKFTQFMDDAEISSFGRWQWSNGFNTALTAVSIDLEKLPSAQPIIRCKECEHWKDSDGVYRRGFGAESKCPLNLKEVYEGTFYCGMAEMGTDG